jgi:tRNA-2-methylthio-N6-dimethylallyladenosine synthase
MTAPAPGRRYHCWTIGCAMNEADSRRLAGALGGLGWTPCDDPRQADLLILNTCVVRQQAEDRVWRRLRYAGELKRRRPGVRIALMGCLVGAHGGSGAKLRPELPDVDVFLPPSDPGPLLRLLADSAPPLPTEDEGQGIRGDKCPMPRHRHGMQLTSCLRLPTPDSRLPIRKTSSKNKILSDSSIEPGRVSGLVPVVLGCSHACTYCVIPYRRGPERSRPPEAVLADARALAAAGARELVLLGQIVDRYGLDLPGAPTLAGLLGSVSKIEHVLRVRFLTSHPLYCTDELIEAVATNPVLCPHFELPVQAGDDEVLVRMRRGYSVADYRALVARIRARIPDVAIHTDIIVGFPGETQAQFERSVALLEELRIDKAHLAKYSPRPQTYAARRLADDVPVEEKDRRLRVLDEIQVRIQAEKNALLQDRVVSVLVEGRDEKRGRWRGRDLHDRLVFFPGPRDCLGRLVSVRITRPGPFALIGEPAE